MSEHVHLHAHHELTESEGASTARAERVIELIATFLLAFATLGIAWSGYEAARWNGRQAERYAAANTARSLANRAATNGDQLRTQDQLNFNRWLEVTTENNQTLAALYERRFRPEFRPAFEAWLAQDPLNNPAAEPSPLRLPQYHVAELEKSGRLERVGTERFDLAKDATENTDSYVLSTVFFAAVLFFAGISIRFAWQLMRITVLVFASISLVYAVVLVAGLPRL
ncbi:MAG TPA: hypothetical protein VEM59_00085 [Acidimicrobiia bacterium]|nr:hypothetical protein [Acidimicrobiia bacterium]